MFLRIRNMKFLTITWTILCVTFILILLGDMINFANDYSAYPIGVEGLTWRYKSRLNYLIESIILSIWLFIPCIMCLLKRINKRKWIISHILITLTYHSYMMLVIYGYDV